MAAVEAAGIGGGGRLEGGETRQTGPSCGRLPSVFTPTGENLKASQHPQLGPFIVVVRGSVMAVRSNPSI